MIRRRGYSLTELFAAMVLTTAAITLLGIWLATTMRSQRAAGEHLQRVGVEERLSRQFRRDVQAAESILSIDEKVDPDLRLRLKFSSYEVHYVRMNKHVERFEQTADKVHRREQFQISPEEVRFETTGGGTMVTLLIGTPPLKIEAALGSDRRHERRAK
jgi:hypothetical protein